MYFLLAPTSQEIYSGLFPPSAPLGSQTEMLEYCRDSLKTMQTINVIPTLKLHTDDYIYYRTDHHWTSFGAYLAYYDAAKAMGFKPSELSEYDIEHFECEINDLQDKNLLINAQIEELSSGNESARADANKKFDEHKKTKSADTIFSNYQPRRKGLEKNKNDKIIELNTLQSNYNNGIHGTGIEMMPAYLEEYDELIKHDLRC